MRAQIFKDWFRTKAGAHNEDEKQPEDPTMAEELTPLIRTLFDQCKIKPLGQEENNEDLGTIMLQIFNLIVEAQVLSISTDQAD